MSTKAYLAKKSSSYTVSNAKSAPIRSPVSTQRRLPKRPKNNPALRKDQTRSRLQLLNETRLLKAPNSRALHPPFISQQIVRSRVLACAPRVTSLFCLLSPRTALSFSSRNVAATADSAQHRTTNRPTKEIYLLSTVARTHFASAA